MTTTHLTAAAADTLTLTIPTPEVLAADTEGRTLTGIVVPYGPVGNTSAGPIAVKAGAVQLPGDLSRVKLVDEHRNPPRPVGYAIRAEDTATGLRMTFHVAATPDGDRALLEASERIRDAFSVEMSDISLDARGTLTAGRLTAVAQVTVPAFSDARVESVAASEHPTPTRTEPPKNGDTMTEDERTELAELRGRENLTQEEAARLTILSNLENAAAEEAAQAATPDQVAAAVITALTASTGGATLPGGLQLPGRQGHTLADLYAAQARVLSGQSRASLEAALSNITQTANVWTQDDAFAGELWSGLQYARRYVAMMAAGRLTGMKGTGWRWVVKPAVADYAGDKTAVPSNAPTTESVEYTAARLAGAHDMDRAVVDFGNTAFIASYYEAMRESYAVQSDVKARDFLVASAPASGTTLSAGAGDGILDAALVAKLELEAGEDGFLAGSPDFYLVNTTDYRGLLKTNASEVSAFLQSLGIDPSKFTATSAVAAGNVVAGVKPATTFYELPGNPIRVETVNIVNGGVDGGVFGYYATLLNNGKGLTKVTIGV